MASPPLLSLCPQLNKGHGQNVEKIVIKFYTGGVNIEPVGMHFVFDDYL